jgi:hypothetical protein
MSNRSARGVEPTFNEIQIPIAIPKNATATAPLALMEGLSVFGLRFVEHEPPHG